MIRRESLFPTRIITVSGHIDGAEYLLQPGPLQSTIGGYTRPEAVAHGCASIVLDFGHELRGGLRIITKIVSHSGQSSMKSANVRIRLGESVSECMSELGERGSCNDHSPRDFSALIVSMSDLTFGQSGFRFARVDFCDANADVSFFAIAADSETLDLPVQWQYDGPDAELKEICAVAKRTIDLCAAGEYVWDGVKRDRLVWIGDMHPEMLALAALYGRAPMMENSIRVLRDTTPDDQWMCTISTYSAWWIIVLADYCRMNGLWEFARENADYAAKVVERFLSVIPEDGTVDIPGLVDWPTKGTTDEPAGIHAILLYMSGKAMELFETLGLPTERAEELRRRLLLKPIRVEKSMAVASLKFFAVGELEPDEIAILKDQGANGLSTFMSYYILTAYAHYFGVSAAVDILKAYYGGMLSRGATTFWEDFHLSWLEGSGRIDELPQEGLLDLHGDFGDFCYCGFRHSFCHAWSTGFLFFLKENGF